MSKNIHDYIQKMRVACQSDNEDKQRTILISAEHMCYIMDMLQILFNSVAKCANDHENNGHQKQALEMINDVIREMECDKYKRH